MEDWTAAECQQFLVGALIAIGILVDNILEMHQCEVYISASAALCETRLLLNSDNHVAHCTGHVTVEKGSGTG